MNDWKLPWTGGCRCDRVRFRVTTPPLVTMACHCRGCQRMTASAFSLSLLMLSEGFALTAGEPAIGGLHGPNRHFHCPHCKSWLFTRPDGMDHLVVVRPTMLDDHAWFVPFIETATSEKLPWASTPAKHSFPDLPPPEQYGPLMQEFAARGPRPG
ncbi:GFA family protein [Nannocystis pusilla]|uniref:GFA family protein n=1 Tax=Nannocystis pusilla TaxID=889268 RepID=A0A9X3EWI4_9BACT|nr:GFA family protein [Nannocystis pusilla]MCY1010809.1 GFA family protein [Nannocystis pusilla]